MASTRRAWTTKLLPSKRSQTAVATPPEPTASCGSAALRPEAERSRTPPAVAPAAEGRWAWITQLVPSKRVQSTVAAPPGPSSTCGSIALSPAAESPAVAARVPSGATRLAWTIESEPSKRLQTTVAVPSAATATSGSTAS